MNKIKVLIDECKYCILILSVESWIALHYSTYSVKQKTNGMIYQTCLTCLFLSQKKIMLNLAWTLTSTAKKGSTHKGLTILTTDSGFWQCANKCFRNDNNNCCRLEWLYCCVTSSTFAGVPLLQTSLSIQAKAFSYRGHMIIIY